MRLLTPSMQACRLLACMHVWNKTLRSLVAPKGPADLCVCLYVGSIVKASCAHFGSLSWGLLGSILEARRVPWAPFWGLWAPLGINFGGLGAPLGSIFEALGLFWCLWSSLEAPLAAQGAQSQIFQFVPPSHFGVILAACWRGKPIQSLI